MSDSENIDSGEIYNRGVRSYIGGDYSKALEYLSKTCKLIASEKSDVCDELFDPYFYYAKALYMYNKYSSDIIGDGVTTALPEDERDVAGTSETNEEVEKVETNDKVEDAKENGHEINEETVETDEVNEEADDSVISVEMKEGTTENSESKEDLVESEEVKNEAGDLAEGKSDQEEDIGYLQMAYETIECAKLIISRQLSEGILNKKDLELKLADCCDVEADIYIEEEVMKEAINQYEQALELRQKHLSSFDRAIAESYYKMAVAYNIDYQLPQAKDYFEKCRNILTINKDMCQKNGESTEELDSILSEIDEKLIETKESIEGYERYKNTLKELLCPRPSVSSTTSKSATVNDISHLVKKKAVKKPHDSKEDVTEGTPSKVPKTDG